ncbi:hypothetical protein BGX20_006061 [Mortierella sp. AD010]|nr:hypothetical protein BGX20_006061 [Mortierella sp. AD010]
MTSDGHFRIILQIEIRVDIQELVLFCTLEQQHWTAQKTSKNLAVYMSGWSRSRQTDDNGGKFKGACGHGMVHCTVEVKNDSSHMLVVAAVKERPLKTEYVTFGDGIEGWKRRFDEDEDDDIVLPIYSYGIIADAQESRFLE